MSALAETRYRRCWRRGHGRGSRSMSEAKIFLLSDGDENVVPMPAPPYATEDVLQPLLARYPALLPGDQIDPENPRRWLLVSREMGVPGDEGETGRWSLDHLL